ncbi:MAG: tRNA threonylcarbamoyladenosine dehydratase [Clostridia bacterium]|nr:tRNA threonylcarbamoyladenosine dehydratase [Clostridia bacterium]
MDERFLRTAMALGEEAVERLKKSRVAVFGAGGVGGHCIEALCRSGVGAIDVIDNDEITLSNLNRQIFATEKTVGRLKAEAAVERLNEINPACRAQAINLFYLPETANEIDLSAYDYIVDAIDTVSAKIALAENAQKAGVPIISCMGAGNKLNPAAFTVCDISKTSVCPLARVMRRELKKRGVDKLKVVYSTEPPLTPLFAEPLANGKIPPASVAFVPAVAGLIAAGEVIKDLCSKNL